MVSDPQSACPRCNASATIRLLACSYSPAAPTLHAQLRLRLLMWLPDHAATGAYQLCPWLLTSAAPVGATQPASLQVLLLVAREAAAGWASCEASNAASQLLLPPQQALAVRRQSLSRLRNSYAFWRCLIDLRDEVAVRGLHVDVCAWAGQLRGRRRQRRRRPRGAHGSCWRVPRLGCGAVGTGGRVHGGVARGAACEWRQQAPRDG
jgi:hypothetical protein